MLAIAVSGGQDLKAFRLSRVNVFSLSEFWPMLKAGLKFLYGDKNEEFYSNILSALASGKLLAWTLHEVEENEYRLLGFALTAVSWDVVSLERDLVIWGVFKAQKSVPLKGIRVAVNALKRHAEETKCGTIKMRVDNPRIATLLKKLEPKAKTSTLLEIST